jgi:hypothetical protein
MKKSDLKKLAAIVDNGTTTMYIPTPKNWKCKRKGYISRVKHKHSTYSSLIKKGAGKYSSKNKKKANPIYFYGQ